MRELETGYLVIGAGASGMSFVDTLLASSDADVVMVDRRHRPGGHWLDAYPFVRLHQPSANYGVMSRTLGNDRIDEAGFYERATAGEICDYYNRVLEETFVPSGRVRFFGMSDYRGADHEGHHFVSLLTGERTTVKVRRKFVDATYVESEIPSKHTPKFDFDPDVRVIPPNDLVALDGSPSGYTVLGAGKTAMDTCNWLLDAGVAPDKIRWIRPRDGWMFDRALMQPLDNVGAYMQLQAGWVQSVADAQDVVDFAHRMEASGVFVRLDTDVEPEFFRGAILSEAEISSLRRIENVVRLGRVGRITTDEIVLDGGTIASDPDQVYVDCTACGVRGTQARPIFEADKITLQYVTIGIVPWSAATIAFVETARDDDAEKNRLCPPLTFSGNASEMLDLAYAGMLGLTVRGMEPDIAEWNEACRLNPGRGAFDHLDDARVPSAFAVLGAQIEPAMSNLARLRGVPATV